jgi:hypothetical protein
MEKIWKIQQLERHIESGVVIGIHWKYTVSSDDFTASHQDVLQIVDDYRNVDTENNFVPFENLDEPKLIEWAITKLGNEFVLHMDEKLSNEVQLHINKTQQFSYGLPWEEVLTEEPEIEE